MDVADDKPVFAAELTPYRSLGRLGLWVLLGVSGILGLGYGLLFLVTGAWPVGVFLGLDFLLLLIALKMSYRSGRRREEICVSRSQVSIRKFSPTGRMVEHRFNPFWARLRINRHDEFGIMSMHVTGEGRVTDVGSFLNPDDKESFAAAFRTALATVTRRL